MSYKDEIRQNIRRLSEDRKAWYEEKIACIENDIRLSQIKKLEPVNLDELFEELSKMSGKSIAEIKYMYCLVHNIKYSEE